METEQRSFRDSGWQFIDMGQIEEPDRFSYRRIFTLSKSGYIIDQFTVTRVFVRPTEGKPAKVFYCTPGSNVGPEFLYELKIPHWVKKLIEENPLGQQKLSRTP